MAISARELLGSLEPGLVPSGKNSTINALLKHGSFLVTLHPVEAGVVTIDWYSGGTGAIVARAKAKKPKVKAVLVAAGSAAAGGAGSLTVKITLTSAGRKLLKHVKSAKLTAEAGFKPSGSARVSTSKPFELYTARTASAAEVQLTQTTPPAGSAASATGSSLRLWVASPLLQPWTEAIVGLPAGGV